MHGWYVKSRANGDKGMSPLTFAAGAGHRRTCFFSGAGLHRKNGLTEGGTDEILFPCFPERAGSVRFRLRPVRFFGACADHGLKHLRLKENIMKFDLVIHVNANDPNVFRLAFSQAANYKKEALLKRHKISPMDIAAKAGLMALEEMETFKLVMVVNGPAVQQLVKENSELLSKAQEAVANGLKIHVGQCAMNSYHVEKDMLWSFVEVVPSATLDLVQLQNAGFAYMKV